MPYKGKEKAREYNQRPEIKKKINERIKNRRKEDKDFLIKSRLRNKLSKIFLKYIKTGKIMTSKLYGVDYELIINSLKPSPADLSKYEIDHKIPLSSFNFINPDGSTNLEEIKKAFAPSNHQWLLIKDNRLKGAKQEKQIVLEIK